MRYNFAENHSSKLTISDLRIWLHLGCSKEEKYHPQLVSLDINLTFNSPPKGAITDKLEDTVCYFEIVKNIQNLCQNRQFNLIEYLSTEVHKSVSQTLGDKKQNISLINVIIHKMSPPVPGIHSGVSFTYCNEPMMQDLTDEHAIPPKFCEANSSKQNSIV